MNAKTIKLTVIRVILGILILCNMAVIFALSAQNSKKSDQTSRDLGYAISESIGQKYEDKTVAEKRFFQDVFLPFFRKFAHAVEFGSLASLIFLFPLTFKGKLWVQYLIALGATLLYAISDEGHQHFTDGRQMAITDIGIDMLGAFVCTSVILGIVALIRYRRKRRAEA
ncbi:MAG: VanZ family protein [Clostridia bacterium]|nr:VanZ family protein [Clostridia bacterium]